MMVKVEGLPTKIGRYRVREQIGAGGMGVVYSARDPELDRLVAIKVLNPDKGKQSWGSEGAARLLREAQAMAQLSHPNVIPVFDCGHLGDGVFMAMELVEGTTLRRWLETPREVADIVRVYSAAGRGLAAAHAAGLVHRDFKPDNVLIGDDGRIRVVDFGLARATESGSRSYGSAERIAELSPEISVSSGALPDENLTVEGAVMGTPVYMAPEQHEGAKADERADQYAFCVALYRALFGEPPFASRDFEKLAREKRRGLSRFPQTNKAIPRGVLAAMRRGLAPNPDDRWPSMPALLDAFSSRSKPTAWVGAVAVVGLFGAASGGLMLDPLGPETSDCEAPASAWSDALRPRVRDALKLVAADASEEHLVALDRYETEWRAAWATACEAGSATPTHTCLRTQHRRFEAITERIAELPAEDAGRLKRLLDRVEPAADCLAPEEKTGRPTPPLDIADAVDEVFAEVDIALSYEVAGRPKEALPHADTAVELAREVGFVPALVEALYRQGRLRRMMGEGNTALEAFTEATTLGEANRLDSVVANASIEAMTTLGLTLGRTDEALEWARRADAAVKRMGEGGLEDARRRHHEGIVRARAGDFDEAHALMTEALAMRRRIQGDGDPDVATTLLDLGALLGDMERHEDAYAMGLQALAAWEKAAGPDHPYAAFARMNIGSDLMNLERYDEAETYLSAAHEILTEALGPTHPNTISALNNLGTLHGRADDLDEALAIATKVLELRLERFGPEHRDVARAHGNLAVTYVKLGRIADAREPAESSLRVLEQVLGPEHHELVPANKVLGEILGQLGELDEAYEHLDRAVGLARSAWGEDNFQVGRMLASRASIELERGNLAEAVSDAEAALERYAGQNRHLGRAGETRFILAKALAAQGDRGAAREAATKARDELTRAPEDAERTAVLADIDAWLAQHAP